MRYIPYLVVLSQAPQCVKSVVVVFSVPPQWLWRRDWRDVAPAPVDGGEGNFLHRDEYGEGDFASLPPVPRPVSGEISLGCVIAYCCLA